MTVLWVTNLKCLVCTQFHLRFSVQGTQALLVLFLFHLVRLSENFSTELVHIFLPIVNAGPILGAVLGDGYLGKYHALLCHVFVQLAGMVTLVLGAVANAETCKRIIMAFASTLGLLVIALGVGGRKPLVPAFGDQIEVLVPKGAEWQIETALLSLWYVGLNSRSFKVQ